MKSKYLSSAEDLEVGDVVLYDGNEMDPVKIDWLGDIFARVSGFQNDDRPFSIMRNRLTLQTRPHKPVPSEPDAINLKI